MVSHYLRGADGVVLCFDVNRKVSDATVVRGDISDHTTFPSNIEGQSTLRGARGGRRLQWTYSADLLNWTASTPRGYRSEDLHANEMSHQTCSTEILNLTINICLSSIFRTIRTSLNGTDKGAHHFATKCRGVMRRGGRHHRQSLEN